MTGFSLLVDVVSLGVYFVLVEPNRTVRVIDPNNALTDAKFELLKAMKHQIRDLLMLELPDERGPEACDALDAFHGVAICRHCARGIGEHFWRRVDRGDRRPEGPTCCFFTGNLGVDARCQRCGAPLDEHLKPSEGPKSRETA